MKTDPKIEEYLKQFPPITQENEFGIVGDLTEIARVLLEYKFQYRCTDNQKNGLEKAVRLLIKVANDEPTTGYII